MSDEILLKQNEDGTFCEYGPYTTIVVETEEDFKDLQKRLELAEKMQWTPCSEKLPEKNGHYLTCDKKGNIHVFWHNDSEKYPFGIGENHSTYFPVVAWMPLPEPYRGEKNG